MLHACSILDLISFCNQVIWMKKLFSLVLRPSLKPNRFLLIIYSHFPYSLQWRIFKNIFSVCSSSALIALKIIVCNSGFIWNFSEVLISGLSLIFKLSLVLLPWIYYYFHCILSLVPFTSEGPISVDSPGDRRCLRPPNLDKDIRTCWFMRYLISLLPLKLRFSHKF